MIRRLWMLVLLAPVLGAQTGTPAAGANFYSIEKEQALGAQLASEYLRTTNVIPSPTVNAYLNQVGQRLVAQTQTPAFRYTFELVDDDRTFIHEPVAFPGGTIFVPASLVLAAKNENELAGMLAHAIAHIAARQGTRQATRGDIANQASIPLIYMGGWQGYTIGQNQSTAIPSGFAKFQRQYELQADTLAVQAMAAAGYDPAALAGYIERSQSAPALPARSTSPVPDRDERLAAIDAAIERLPATSYPAHDGFAAMQEEVARLSAKSAKAPPRLAR